MLSESKKGALEEAGVMSALRQGVEDSFDLVRLFPVLPGVFFWPEEDWFSSEGVDNAGLFQLVKVHERDEGQRISRPF